MLTKIEKKDFDKIFKIIEESFPEDEYRPYSEQLALMDNPRYTIYTLLDGDKNIKAFISIWDFDDFFYGEHFAVSPVYRNAGLGSHILSDLFKEVIKDRKMCLEVEVPEAGEMPKRRIAFYERNGFYYNDYYYIQPPISTGRNPMPLKIMTTGGVIEKEQFEKIRDILHKNVYGLSSPMLSI